MSDTNEKYMALVTSEYADSVKFNLMLQIFLDMVSPAVDCLTSFDTIFDLDNAVGDQLDILGSLVGLTRVLPIDDEDVPAVLTDDLFRKVIQARIMSNKWDGTLESWVGIIQSMFSDASFEVVDNQDMSVTVVIIDPGADPALTSLLTHGYIIPKPAGVLISYEVTDDPLFGHDLNTDLIQGYDLGIWANR